jgi:hypothetical protein
MLVPGITAVGYPLGAGVFLLPLVGIATCTPWIEGVSLHYVPAFVGQCYQRSLIVGVGLQQAVFEVVLYQYRAAKVMNFQRMVSNTPTILYLVLQILVDLQAFITITPNLIHYPGYGKINRVVF